jgi:hypothetical protein
MLNAQLSARLIASSQSSFVVRWSVGRTRCTKQTRHIKKNWFLEFDGRLNDSKMPIWLRVCTTQPETWAFAAWASVDLGRRWRKKKEKGKRTRKNIQLIPNRDESTQERHPLAHMFLMFQHPLPQRIDAKGCAFFRHRESWMIIPHRTALHT